MNFGLLFGLVLFQQTWVVDDDGGAGADFTDLPAAVDAAGAGDVLRVRAGSYSHFTLTGKGASIVAEGEVRVDRAGPAGPFTEIASVPATSRVVLAGLEFLGPICGAARVSLSGATTRASLIDVVVVGQGNVCSGLSVSSAEVLLVGASLSGGSGEAGGPALRVSGGARMWVVRSVLTGGGGVGGFFSDAFGGQGLRVDAGSRVWLADTQVLGGTGILGAGGGFGGAGILAWGSARVRVSGAAGGWISGGLGGVQGGPGILAVSGARVRVHEVEVWSGASIAGPPAQRQIGGFAEDVPLPSLACERTPGAPGEATLTLSGGPASAPFFVWLDGRPRIPATLPAAPIVGEFALVPDWRNPLLTGVLSAAGEFTTTIPVSTLGSFYLPLRLQAAIGHPTGTMLLSNPTEFVTWPGGARAKRAP